MTKAELVSKLAEETEVTKKFAAAMLDSLVRMLQAGLKDGGKIRIDGLGMFAVADRKARNGHLFAVVRKRLFYFIADV